MRYSFTNRIEYLQFAAFIRRASGREKTSQNERKVFCIGRNKTGTTSLEAALKKAGLRVGSQPIGESLIYDWSARRFDRIVELCRSAEAFQDVPFSLPYTFEILDFLFPRSRFILSVRDNADEWYDSLIRFHKKIIGEGRVPTPDDLKNHWYHHKGFLWDSARLIYGIDEESLYDEHVYKAHYNKHNENVLEYFRHRRDDLLVINFNDENAENRLGAFLGIANFQGFLPQLNRTQ